MSSQPAASIQIPGQEPQALLTHVVVGIDSTAESVIAAAQAAALSRPGGRLVLVAVAENHLAAHAGTMAPEAGDLLRADTEANLEAARQLADADEAVVRSGPLAEVLCDECERRGATLAAVGARAHGRLSALAFGGHDTALLRRAPCSLLIARNGWGPHRPSRVLFAAGALPGWRTVDTTAREIAERLGSDIVPVIGLAEAVDLDVLRAERADGIVDTGSPADAVAAAATRDSLVVVGWDEDRPGEVRRVVYGSRCSVLVVRPSGSSGRG